MTYIHISFDILYISDNKYLHWRFDMSSICCVCIRVLIIGLNGYDCVSFIIIDIQHGTPIQGPTQEATIMGLDHSNPEGDMANFLNSTFNTQAKSRNRNA